MKNGLTLFVLLAIATSAASQSYDYRNPIIDVQHYAFDIEVNDANDTLKGAATISYKVLIPTTKVSFDLMNIASSGKGMKVTSVSENGKQLLFDHSMNKLTVQLPDQTTKNQESSITINYRGIPADGLIISRNKYKDRTFFSDNWPNRARHWLPTIDHPSDKAAVEWNVTAPQQYQVIANGLQVEEINLDNNKRSTRYIEKTALPTKVMVIGLAEFAVFHQGNVDCIPVSSWVYKQDRDKGKIDYRQATEILPFFISKVGPFAYPKLANVQSKTVFGGMENAGAIFYFEASVNGKGEHEGLIAHEIAHQWFGNMATEKHWSHVWLSEGFASYMTHLYLEEKYGFEKMKENMARDRSQVIAFSKKNNKPIVDTAETNYMNLLNANSYQKGSWVLHMLRQQLGDSAFWKGVRNYYATYAGKNAETDDLRKIMEDASGKNLQKFFHQWLFTPGQPNIKVNWRYDGAKKILNVDVNQLQPNIFAFPLQLLIRGGGDDGIMTKSIVMENNKASFSIPLQSKPLAIEADPNVLLLAEISVSEMR